MPRGPGLDQQFGENPNPQVLSITDQHLRKAQAAPEQQAQPAPATDVQQASAQQARAAREAGKQQAQAAPAESQQASAAQEGERAKSRSLPTVVTSPQQEGVTGVQEAPATAGRAASLQEVPPLEGTRTMLEKVCTLNAHIYTHVHTHTSTKTVLTPKQRRVAHIWPSTHFTTLTRTEFPFHLYVF